MVRIQNGSFYLLVICFNLLMIKNVQAQSQLPTPIFSVSDTVFKREIELKIMVPESCIVYLTTNGAIPTRKDEKYYNGSILTFDSSVTLTAKAFRFYSEVSESSNVRWEDGGIVNATYTKILLEPYAQIMPISRDSISVVLFSYDRDANLYYTTDESVPDSFSYRYKDVFHVPSNAIIKVVAIKAGSITSSIYTMLGPKVNVLINTTNKAERIGQYRIAEKYVLLNGKMINDTHNKKKNAVSDLLLRKNKLSIFKISGEN